MYLLWPCIAYMHGPMYARVPSAYVFVYMQLDSSVSMPCTYTYVGTCMASVQSSIAFFKVFLSDQPDQLGCLYGVA